MTLEKVTGKGFKAKILGKEYLVQFQVRNFIALKKRFNIEMYDLVNKVLNADMEAIIYMIWCGTLVFNDFDISDPVSIKEEIDLKQLYEMDGNLLREISLNISKGLLDSLPKADAKKKQKTTGMVAEALKKIKTILKMK